MKYTLLIAVFFVSCAHTNLSTDKGTDNKVRMAVTVNDLPLHGDMPPGKTRLGIARDMIETFKKYSVPQVYGFVNAQRNDVDPSLVEVLKFWVDSGHPLGNHTYSHKDINKVSSEEYIAEIDKDEKTLQTYGQSFDWKYFRYPFTEEGNTPEKRNAVRQHLLSKGYKIAEVTVNPKDWAWNDAYVRCVKMNNQPRIDWLKEMFMKNAQDQLVRAKKISQTVFHRQIPHILEMHIGSFSALMMDDLLKMYQKEGVEFIPLTQALKDPAYSIDPGVANKFGTLFELQVMEFKKIDMKETGVPIREEFNKSILETVCQY